MGVWPTGFNTTMSARARVGTMRVLLLVITLHPGAPEECEETDGASRLVGCPLSSRVENLLHRLPDRHHRAGNGTTVAGPQYAAQSLISRRRFSNRSPLRYAASTPLLTV